ncbi:hypothetical protein [Agromyces sp. M3QZ16-3]|uniref:hypothetical protein n=1 Tax=Agromyces sp. M3QZ16-3 TaxID=3447585 RepID=UPI003F68E6DB
MTGMKGCWHALPSEGTRSTGSKLLLDQGRHAGCIATMVAGCAAIIMLAVALERRASATANGAPEPSPGSAPAAAPSAETS